MKRPALTFANLLLAGRHCHPLGLVLAALVFAALGAGAFGAHQADALVWAVT